MQVIKIERGIFITIGEEKQVVLTACRKMCGLAAFPEGGTARLPPELLAKNQLFQHGIKVFNLAAGVLQGAGAVDHKIGAAAFFVSRHLARDA